MKFTFETQEQDVREFLQERFAHLDDASARTIALSEGYLQILRPGKPPCSERNSIYDAVSHRTDNATIDTTISAMLSDENLENVENIKRSYHERKKRSHPLLDPSHIYNKNDFLDAILAKQFDIAAAIFATSKTVTKKKILSFLNKY
ncbi:hypothetical protein [Shinella zoogloeoides]|uniref:hypothetical protein n=1 Tax=Shinella zoogloeoides TaxID=352475 RepID=UPI001F5765AD|nr:hypothetical protein [Shinella zoogloeoides]